MRELSGAEREREPSPTEDEDEDEDDEEDLGAVDPTAGIAREERGCEGLDHRPAAHVSRNEEANYIM